MAMLTLAWVHYTLAVSCDPHTKWVPHNLLPLLSRYTMDGRHEKYGSGPKDEKPIPLNLGPNQFTRRFQVKVIYINRPRGHA
ncbi:hypothetical protein BDV26DRAFT_269240 [Aspergillus bertholletiae]|uniref:Uncharacterized protein n=1 Tax=Aspergillus bertholletiae TaxID=1226010 RepID=A0A5N7AYP5_9EURO|nr:hypothetical protein BDV26DRAFT_269240 [Aspergillus bertholletiae]